jgi:hypothetical protein
LAYNKIEAQRQALFGYRRDESGEIVDPLWDPGSLQAKVAMELARFRVMGYFRNYQGQVVNSLEEAVQHIHDNDLTPALALELKKLLDKGGYEMGPQLARMLQQLMEEELSKRPSQSSLVPGSHQRLQSVAADLSSLQAQADRLTRSIRGLQG